MLKFQILKKIVITCINCCFFNSSLYHMYLEIENIKLMVYKCIPVIFYNHNYTFIETNAHILPII
jgi:hypothetical protein